MPLDGKMLSDKSSFNTAALTGESKPKTIESGEVVLAGMLNLDRVVEIEVTRKFADSLSQESLSWYKTPHRAKHRPNFSSANLRKYIRQLFQLWRWRSPFFRIVQDYVFNDWLYRALIFLVVSCPCALVISIPLGYFGGIGAASRNGIYFLIT